MVMTRAASSGKQPVMKRRAMLCVGKGKKRRIGDATEIAEASGTVPDNSVSEETEKLFGDIDQFHFCDSDEVDSAGPTCDNNANLREASSSGKAPAREGVNVDRLSIPYKLMSVNVERFGFSTWYSQGVVFKAKITVRSALSAWFGLKKKLKRLGLVSDFANTCFGHFLELPEQWSKFNAQLVHSLILRKITNIKSKHEMWFLIGDLPCCFGLREFALVTGLKCGSYPSEAQLKVVEGLGENFYKKVLGQKTGVYEDEILACLDHTRFSKDEKLKLSLVWFLHAILLARGQNAYVPKKLITMVASLDFFNKYPWGKECFDLTLDYLNNKANIAKFHGAPIQIPGKQPRYYLYGFPWAIIVWAYEALPFVGVYGGKPEKGPHLTPRMFKWRNISCDRRDPLRLELPKKLRVRPYLYPTVGEMEQSYVKDLVPYNEEVDKVIVALKEEIGGATEIFSKDMTPKRHQVPVEATVEERHQVPVEATVEECHQVPVEATVEEGHQVRVEATVEERHQVPVEATVEEKCAHGCRCCGARAEQMTVLVNTLSSIGNQLGDVSKGIQTMLSIGNQLVDALKDFNKKSTVNNDAPASPHLGAEDHVAASNDGDEPHGAASANNGHLDVTTNVILDAPESSVLGSPLVDVAIEFDDV